ncbi:phosphonate C-P lyase system protein PhnG [Devosia sp.]|uniref:phosphonate C-P lyase system protein PhnG n=1 Tax=Devosia sp. TaxID=1871048 RepID=UPI003BACCD9E
MPSSAPKVANNPRQEAMAVLAQAPGDRLSELWAAWPTQPSFHKVRGPETGLVMVRGRAGGGGNPFNLGEATVTRATVRLETGEVGHAYCLGRDGNKAVIAACFDALLQRDPEGIEAKVLAPLRVEQATADQQLQDETAATKVDFFTMVRGDD